MNGFKRIIGVFAVISLIGCAPPKSPFALGKSSSKRKSQPKECLVHAADLTENKLLSLDHSFDSYIVKLRSKDSHSLSSLQARPKLRVFQELRMEADEIAPGYMRVAMDTTNNRLAALEQLADSPDIEYIEPDYPISIYSFNSNDPLLSKQWAHERVGSEQAWSIGAGSRSVVVAVVDSGIDYNHRDLRDNMWRNPAETLNGRDDDRNGYVDDIYGWNFADNNNDPIANDPESYHGTHVAGTIGATGGNNIGITGHSPEVRLMALKFINNGGSGRTSDAIRAIDYAVGMGAKIINNSWGSKNWSLALYQAISRSEEAGVLFVAAAGNIGNNNDTQAFYPAAYPHNNILTVAATDPKDQPLSWSNYGQQSVDIGAPGSSILSTGNNHRYFYLSGTSMAAPLVSGVAATMLALQPQLGAQDIIQILMSTVDRKTGLHKKVRSGGRINAQKALEAVIQLEPLPEPPLDEADGGSGGTGEDVRCF